MNPHPVGNQPQIVESHATRSGFTVTEVLVSIAIIGILLAITLPAVQSARAAAARMDCQSRLKQIILASHEYEASFGKLPGTFGTNTWHVRLLPYLEDSELNETHSVYACPADPLAEGRLNLSMVSFHANHGFGGNEGYIDQGLPLKQSDIMDGLSQTAAYGERLAVPDPTRHSYYPTPSRELWIRVFRKTAIYRADRREFAEECRDRALDPRFVTISIIGYTHTLTPNLNSCFNGPFRISPDYFKPAVTASSLHPGGINVAIADGSVKFVSSTVDQDVWWALGTRDGGEAIVGSAF